MDSRSPTKRKRALSTTSTTYSATPSSSTIINPLSHPPSTLKQFLPAGNSPDAPLPSSIYPDFPHRPLPSSPTSSHPRSQSRSRRSSFASTTFNSDAGDTDAETDGWTTITDHDTISVTSTGKPYAKRDPVRSTAKLHKAHQSRVGALVAIIQRCLAEGDIALARRAFGLLVRADVNGRKVDLRFGGYWELGAEVLMRVGENQGNQLGGGSQGGLFGDGTQMEEEKGIYGEGPSGEGGEMEEEDTKERKERNRLLRAAQNRDRVRAYYETLIHLHPWSRLHPNKIGAVDFYPALFGFEMEACFAEHRYGVEQLDRHHFIDDDDDDLPKFGGDDDHMQIDQQSALLLDPLRSSPPSPSAYYPSHSSHSRQMDTVNVHPLYRTEMEEDERRSKRPEVRLRREKEKLRIKALEQMKDVARRMDAVLENTPYNKDVELVRLRAMVALYVGDLSVPVTVTQVEGEGGSGWKSHEERMNEEEGRGAQAAERDRARVLFIKMRELRGGELEEGDEWILELIGGGGGGAEGDGEDEDVEGEEEEGGDRGRSRGVE
ncbi:uncharacterized protein B0T23DRAFT_448578 [Neurospora hispaniola]|uniref:Uncharacterized protein n=1 Tax=Neurospora hispaniola TaxID=588809 RepID=A0AAJ0MMA3_9PEZI|nr:hypothetical protein B0T23DRAFT_448578 [Neurospora hispaniola]